MSVNTLFVFLFKVFPDDMVYRATPTHAHGLYPLIAAIQTLLNVILKALISLLRFRFTSLFIWLTVEV